LVLRKQLRRRDVLAFFARLRPTIVAMEACGGSHYWGRELARLGHTVRLIAPQLAKHYVKRGKNDAADAEALEPGAGGAAAGADRVGRDAAGAGARRVRRAGDGL